MNIKLICLDIECLRTETCTRKREQSEGDIYALVYTKTVDSVERAL